MNLSVVTEGRPSEHEAPDGSVEDYLAHARAHVQSLIIEVIDDWLLETNSRHLQVFRARLLDYPLREAKALRPAICIATALALGGTLEAAAPNAVVLELYHNAFLIHDDIEDGSSERRGR